MGVFSSNYSETMTCLGAPTSSLSSSKASPILKVCYLRDTSSKGGLLTLTSDIITSSMRAALSIDPQPSASHNLDLAQDLLDQDLHSRGTEGQHGFAQFKSTSSIRGGFSASGLVRSTYLAIIL